MGILQNLARKFIDYQQTRGYTPTANIHPQENYDAYSHLPGTALGGDYRPNRYRKHAPFAARLSEFAMQDEGNTYIERVPNAPLQSHFNEKMALPPVDVFVPAHGVQVPTPTMKRGWNQTFIQEETPHQNLIGFAPPPQLSKPIRVRTIETTVRAPITGARAPKPKRGGR
jgi:hypothetical protein